MGRPRGFGFDRVDRDAARYGGVGDARERQEQATEAALKDGLEVRYPGPTELFVDIDSDYQAQKFVGALRLLKGLEPKARLKSDRPSKSGGAHRHIVVDLGRPIKNEAERIMLQALLASDPVREMYSLERMYLGLEHPTAFFDTKGK